MKINKIEIYNLNSLKGYWCIDLTAPEYLKNHNQFVIHGGTGSGKTTILDAITLALYGRTPRLETKIIEEMMTKHTTSCMASVTYECKKGNYKSTFTLSRAHDRLDGNIKHGFHILNLDTNEDTGNINAFDKIEKATKEIIQLGFDQFCRSILLAQGCFDTFITSSENDRAVILGKMSGIDYQDIGKEIWYKAKSKKSEFETARDKLAALKEELLDEDVVKQLEAEQNSIPEQNEQLQKNINEIIELITWVNNVDDLLQEKNAAERERKDFEIKKEEFKEQKKRLKKAEQALNCEASYQSYSHLETEDIADQNSLSELNTALLETEYKNTEKKQAEVKAEESLNKKREEGKKLEVIWKDVGKMDDKITNGTERLKELQKRYVDAEKKLFTEKKEIEDLNASIKENESQLEKAERYVEENKADESIETVLMGLNSKKDAIEGSLKKIQNASAKKDQEEKILAELAEKKQALEEKLEKTNENLQKLFSTEYYSFAVLLRNKLENGKTCPVCGSTDHPLCNKKENVSLNENASKVVELVKDIDEYKLKLQNIDNELGTKNNLLKHITEEIDYEKNTIQESVKFINEEIKLWNYKIQQLDSTNELEEIIKALRDKNEAFGTQQQSIIDCKKNIETDKKLLFSIKIEDLEKQYLDEKNLYEKHKEILDMLGKQRYELFGNKIVDEEENNFKRELETLDEALKNAQSEVQKTSEGLITLQVKISDTQKRMEARKDNLKKALDTLQLDLQQNNFKNIEDYLQFRISRDEIDKIRQLNEQLSVQDTETKTSLKNSEKKYNEIRNLNKTEKSIEELNNQKVTFENQKMDNAARLQEIESKLKRNQENRAEYEKQKLALDGMQESFDIWSKIQDMIGKKDGETFQKYVQVLSFRNLLIKANAHLKSISDRYELIQIPGKVDCLVHDEDNYPDSKDDRPLANMSGGEKFIISLSLALGIAEIASKNVRVDSLFLDEGFGTLSGEPLTRSINALKKLQTTGKMLGIITHMPDVISAFDQRIEAKPMKKNSGYSQLEGAGITYAKNWK